MTPATRAELTLLVDGRDDVVKALAAVLAQHQSRKGEVIPFDVPSQDYVRRRRAAERLLQAVERLEQAWHEAPEDLVNALAGAAPHLHSGSLHGWAEDLFCLSEEVRYLRSIQHGRRGAPVNHERRWLEWAIAQVLRRAGLRLTKGRNGRLAKILTVMYEAAGEAVPEDTFPILKRLCR